MPQNTLIVSVNGFAADDIGPYTPNLSRMVEVGQTFTLYGSPSASATQACVMSGLYGFRNGVGTRIRADDAFEMNPFLASLPYGANHFSGQWDLAPETQRLHPAACGIDRFNGSIGYQPTEAPWIVVKSSAGSATTLSYSFSQLIQNESCANESIDGMKTGVETVWCSFAPTNELGQLDDRIGELTSAAVQLGYRVLIYAAAGVGYAHDPLAELSLSRICIAYGWTDLPKNALIHAVDLTSLITGNCQADAKPIGSRDYLYSEEFEDNGSVPDNGTRSWAIRDRRWKLIVGPDSESVELYDLLSDPLETQDIAEEFSEEAARLMDEGLRIQSS